MQHSARQLHMSERPLQRKLSNEDTSFNEILTNVRHELALKYLQDERMGIQGIALQLGYNQVCSFSTAFKAWPGMVNHVSAQAKQLLMEVEQENSVLAAQRPSLKATLAGEMRLLRAIVSIVIAEMTRQLGPIDAS